MARPAVDIVVPFAGSAAALAEVVARMGALELAAGDTVTVVDNRPAAEITAAPASDRVRVIEAPERQSSYHARNRGAAAGANPWILFLDGDVRPAPGLLDALFDPDPQPRTGVLAGGIADTGDDAVALGVADHASLGEDVTLGRQWAYAQTANAAVRREAFDAVGGFVGDIRSAGDADLCFRLRDAGWAIERRPHARVGHVSRDRLRSLAGQKARHGAGAAWLERRWPGSMPPEHVRAADLVRDVARAARRAAAGDREAARAALVRPTTWAAFHAGRRLSNEAPAGRERWRPLDGWLR